MGDDMTELNTPMSILKAALKKEKASYRFYDDLLKKHKSIEILREMIEQLREEEYRHIQIIEKKITKLGLD